MNDKTRITLTKSEVKILAHLTRHFADYMFGDDRPDHGMGILKGYREEYFKHIRSKDHDFLSSLPDNIQTLLNAMGKLNRKSRKL